MLPWQPTCLVNFENVTNMVTYICNHISLKNELEKLQEQLANNPNDGVQQHYFTNIKELELINNERTRGAQIRAHALHVELNETNSKYFLNKEINESAKFTPL